MHTKSFKLTYRNELSTSSLWERRLKSLLSPLPALERTFLGYLRTSLALAMLSVIIAQLFRLEHAQRPDKVFGYFALGIPLACVCTGTAIVVLLLGAHRFWRQQNAILRGKVHAGGWEMLVIGLMIALVGLCLSCGSKWLIGSLGRARLVCASCRRRFKKGFCGCKLIGYGHARKSGQTREKPRFPAAHDTNILCLQLIPKKAECSSFRDDFNINDSCDLDNRENKG